MSGSNKATTMFTILHNIDIDTDASLLYIWNINLDKHVLLRCVRTRLLCERLVWAMSQMYHYDITWSFILIKCRERDASPHVAPLSCPSKDIRQHV